MKLKIEKSLSVHTIDHKITSKELMTSALMFKRQEVATPINSLTRNIFFFLASCLYQLNFCPIMVYRIKFIITKVEDIIDTLNSFSRFSRYSRVLRFSRLHRYIMTNDPTYEHLDIKHVLMDVKKYKLNLKLEHIINCSFVINSYTNTFTNTRFNLHQISCCRIS